MQLGPYIYSNPPPFYSLSISSKPLIPLPHHVFLGILKIKNVGKIRKIINNN